MQIWILFVLVMLVTLTRKTKYKNLTTTLLFLYFFVNIASYFRIYPCSGVSSLRNVRPFIGESDLHPGDVISTHRRICTSPSDIAIRLAYTALSGNAFFHTALVVNYNNQKFVLHALMHEFDINEKKSYPNVQVVGTSSIWKFMLEPLDVFLSIERRHDSMLRVTSLGKSIDYKEDIVRGIEKEPVSILHCAYVVGKYLELYGVVKNTSMFSDLLYYHPGYYSEYFGNARYFKL